MSDDLKHCHCGCIYAEVDCPNCNHQSPADRIEQLEAKLAEALAVAKIWQEDFIQENNRWCDASRKLAKAVERLTDMRNNQTGYRHVAHFRRGASVTLAELEKMK